VLTTKALGLPLGAPRPTPPLLAGKLYSRASRGEHRAPRPPAPVAPRCHSGAPLPSFTAAPSVFALCASERKARPLHLLLSPAAPARPPGNCTQLVGGGGMFSRAGGQRRALRGARPHGAASQQGPAGLVGRGRAAPRPLAPRRPPQFRPEALRRRPWRRVAQGGGRRCSRRRSAAGAAPLMPRRFPHSPQTPAPARPKPRFENSPPRRAPRTLQIGGLLIFAPTATAAPFQALTLPASRWLPPQRGAGARRPGARASRPPAHPAAVRTSRSLGDLGGRARARAARPLRMRQARALPAVAESGSRARAPGPGAAHPCAPRGAAAG
jgi:hypothetical protein